MRRIARILLAGSFALALACGSLALVTDARAGKPPKNWDCSTVSATGCVEIPLFPPS